MAYKSFKLDSVFSTTKIEINYYYNILILK